MLSAELLRDAAVKLISEANHTVWVGVSGFETYIMRASPVRLADACLAV
jgi:hypothetical protein